MPARYAGRRLEVRLSADTIRVLDPSAHGKVIATHVRSLHKGSEDLVLDHYLEVLVRKPGALAGATALASARASGAFTPTHQRFWDTARRAHGDAGGTRCLVGVLLLHRTMSSDAMAAGMGAALGLGNYDPNLVAVEARRASGHDDTGTPPVPLPPGAAPAAAVTRPVPSLTRYDQLLTSPIRIEKIEEATA